MKSITAGYYDKHYPAIQQAKYEEAWRLLKDHFPRKINALLDMGIGYAWLEVLLKKKKVRMKRIMGVDTSENAIAPPRKNITYILDDDFEPSEKYDVVISWDAWHCFPEKKLLEWVKPNGLLLVSEPAPFVKQLEKIMRDKKIEILVDEWVGDVEKSRAMLILKK